MTAAVLKFMALAKGKPSLDELHDGLASLSRGLGFDRHAYVVSRSPKTLEMCDDLTRYQDGPTVCTNYLPSWIDRYDEANYFYVDPILRKAWFEYSPFRWDNPALAGDAGPRQREMFDEARSIGMARGITIPLHGPADGLSMLCFCGDLSQRDFDDCWRDYRGDLMTVAAYTHEAILGMGTRPRESAQVRLSPRELECLNWTSEGKTNWEISLILDISQETVRSYLREASQKLGVHSKHHAVVKAIRAGLIQG